MTRRPAGGPGRRRGRVGVCLSLSGRYARFGRQAALGLDIWRSLDGSADLLVADDRSDPRVLETAIRRVSAESDILLGPYSTQLARVAGRVAAQTDRLLWNHGGAGDDAQSAHPGHVVSVPTPASRYAEPFLRRIASRCGAARLWIAEGSGGFGRQVAAGAETTARELGIETIRVRPGADLPSREPASDWALFCAGSFEEDVRVIQRARALPEPPRTVCAVAAGVLEFGRAISAPEGVFGVGQWSLHRGHTARVGPAEAAFVAAYTARAGVPPDYPAVQAAAGAALALHCARLAGGTERALLWPAARALRTETLFGTFEIDPHDGVQIGHEAVLTRWTPAGPAPA